MYKKFSQFWVQERNLLILLIILSIHMFLIIPFGERSFFGRIIISLFYLFLLTAGVNYLTGYKKYASGIIVAIVCITLLATKFFVHEDWVSILSDVFLIVFCSLLAWIVLSKTFSAGPITIYRIEGSIVGYLLMGLFFANVQNLIFHLNGESAFNGLHEPGIREFLYFSLVTLTTVGYGDISPAIPASRSIANIEALVGQLYPAILIARLVSMEFSGRK